MLKAIDVGDYKAWQTMEDDLTMLGRTDEAQKVTDVRKVMVQAQPYLTASRFEPFGKQRDEARKFFARSGLQGAGKEGAVSNALSVVERGLTERENSFRRDPAGYIAGHPLLSQEGLSPQEYRKREGLTVEDYYTHSLELRAHLGQGTGLNPRVLPQAQATAVKDQYDGLADPQQKVELLRKISKESGQYGMQVMAEVGMPIGVTAFAQVLPALRRPRWKSSRSGTPDSAGEYPVYQ